MGKDLNNVMEAMITQIYEEHKDELNCCQCEQCRNEILSYALNHLPPRYVSTDFGEAVTKASALSVQTRADLLAAVVNATEVVSRHPRHKK